MILTEACVPDRFLFGRNISLCRMRIDMEYRRINNNAVQCIITKEDMEGYGLTIVDIFERNEKGEKFLRDVVQEALEEVGGEMSGGNIAMQISPTQDKGLVITFSDAGPSAMLDMLEHIKSALVNSGMDMEKVLEQIQQGGELPETEQENAIETVVKAMDRAEAQTRVFVFYALSDVISFANAAFGEKKMGSKLYKLNDLYYLVLMKKRISQKDFDKLSCQAVEFADPIRYGFKQVDYLEEHGECLIPAQAIGKLKKIG